MGTGPAVLVRTCCASPQVGRIRSRESFFLVQKDWCGLFASATRMCLCNNTGKSPIRNGDIKRLVVQDLGYPVCGAEVLFCQRPVMQYDGDEARNFGAELDPDFRPWWYHGWYWKADVVRLLPFFAKGVRVLVEQAWLVDTRHG